MIGKRLTWGAAPADFDGELLLSASPVATDALDQSAKEFLGALLNDPKGDLATESGSHRRESQESWYLPKQSAARQNRSRHHYKKEGLRSPCGMAKSAENHPVPEAEVMSLVSLDSHEEEFLRICRRHQRTTMNFWCLCNFLNVLT